MCLLIPVASLHRVHPGASEWRGVWPGQSARLQWGNPSPLCGHDWQREDAEFANGKGTLWMVVVVREAIPDMVVTVYTELGQSLRLVCVGSVCTLIMYEIGLFPGA